MTARAGQRDTTVLDARTWIIASRPWTGVPLRPPMGLGKSGGHWPIRKGPGPLLAERYKVSRWTKVAPWVEHLYCIKHPDGRRGYVAEPYVEYIDDAALADFAFLESCGFSVEISAEKARHYPGRTVAVIFWEPRV